VYIESHITKQIRYGYSNDTVNLRRELICKLLAELFQEQLMGERTIA